MQTFDFRQATRIVSEVSQEVLDATSWNPEPDPNWQFLDAKGHGHFYHTEDDPYPTLRPVRQAFYNEDGEKRYYRAYWKCRHCRQRIVPGTLPPKPTVVAGLRRWTVYLTLPITVPQAQAMDLLNVVDRNEQIAFQLPGWSGQGYITEVTWPTDGALSLTLLGSGPLVRDVTPPAVTPRTPGTSGTP